MKPQPLKLNCAVFCCERKLKKYCVVFYCCFIFAPIVCVADDVDNEIVQKTATVEQLKSAIAEIDSEFLRCKKSKTVWTTATVIGGAGVVATGTAATIQGVKLIQTKNKNKKTTNE